MTDYFIHATLYKALSNSEEAIQEQLKIFELFISDLAKVNPLLEKWYVNNATSSKPPLDYPFPSEKAKNYLFKLRKEDKFSEFLLWNSHVDSDSYVDASFNVIGINMKFSEGFNLDQIQQLFSIMLKYLAVNYIHITTRFYNSIRVFEHRLAVSPICYVPKVVANDEMPFLYKTIQVSNDLNSGTILIFDENIFDESDSMKKKIQENAIALVELGVLPPTESSADYFSDLTLGSAE